MKILLGSTGLIGQTLKKTIKFDYEYNSKNIDDFLNHEYNDCELYLSCLPATKWFVNKDIPSDIENINKIIQIISKKTYKRVILFSTIDVYTDTPLLSDENTPIHFKSLSYGTNRYLFELLIQEFVKTSDLKIFRLPALFSKKIKKNVLYDLIHDNNVDQINLNSAFQWYNLENLTKDIDYFIQNFEKETLFNFFTEPLDTTDIVSLFPHYTNIKYSTPTKFEYNFKTVHFESGYIKNKEEVLNEIKELVNEQKSHEIVKPPNEYNKLPVIMCVWQRVDGFEQIIRQLNNQTYKNFKLFVWNNNIKLKDTFEKLLQVYANFDYEVYHSEKNIGGFGRFYYGQKVKRKPDLMDYCVFIDDDQTFGNEILEIFYKERETKTIKSQYGFKFNGLDYHENRVQIKSGEELHYAGTGGMIMDMSILEDPNLYDCKSEYWFVEDLWLSFFANKIHGYKLIKSSVIIKNGDDQHSLYKRVKHLKTPMLNYLVKEQNWDIL